MDMKFENVERYSHHEVIACMEKMTGHAEDAEWSYVVAAAIYAFHPHGFHDLHALADEAGVAVIDVIEDIVSRGSILNQVDQEIRAVVASRESA